MIKIWKWIKTFKNILKIIVFAMILLWIVLNSDMLFNFLGTTYNLIFPFILGIAIAFVLNILTKFF